MEDAALARRIAARNTQQKCMSSHPDIRQHLEREVAGSPARALGSRCARGFLVPHCASRAFDCVATAPTARAGAVGRRDDIRAADYLLTDDA